MFRCLDVKEVKGISYAFLIAMNYEFILSNKLHRYESKCSALVRINSDKDLLVRIPSTNGLFMMCGLIVFSFNSGLKQVTLQTSCVSVEQNSI